MTPSRISRAMMWVATGVSAALFLCSLLVFVSAPTGWLWIVAIVASEWGHFAAVAALLLVALTFRGGRLGAINAAIALLAAALFATPTIRAAILARGLPTRCTSAFANESTAHAQAGPLRIVDLFRGFKTSDVDVTEHVYGDVGRKPLELDLYRASGAAGVLPVIVMIHGGSWNGGSKAQLRAVNRYLARQQYAVAAINYRHAPKWPFPAAVDDVFRTIDFLRANASEFQLDASRIVLVGRSAGGQIALSAAYAGRDPSIRGVVSFYGPTDLVLGYEKPSRRAVLDSEKALEDYLGGSPAQNPEAYAAASPLNHVTAASPPTLLIHGGLDPIVWPIHSEQLAQRLDGAGVRHLYLRLPWATHGCDANLSGPSGQLSLYAMHRFFESVLAPR